MILAKKWFVNIFIRVLSHLFNYESMEKAKNWMDGTF